MIPIFYAARDHGVRPYNDYRALCNLTRARTWSDFEREIPSNIVARLKQLYESVDDVDLFPGGLSETPLPGGVIGPTFSCIVAGVFSRLRKCDRFWWGCEISITVGFNEILRTKHSYWKKFFREQVTCCVPELCEKIILDCAGMKREIRWSGSRNLSLLKSGKAACPA